MGKTAAIILWAFVNQIINFNPVSIKLIIKEQMKKLICVLLLLATTARLMAADIAPINSPATNSPAAKGDSPKNEGAAIPDATHKPVFTTNTVTIAGQPVKYVAETGMLPILKADGTTRASVFYVA